MTAHTLALPALLALAVTPLLGGCMAVEAILDDRLVIFGPREAVAVGEPVRLGVADACLARQGRGWDGKIPSPSPDSPCSTEQVVELRSVEVSPEGIVDLRREDPYLEVTPRREGRVIISVVAVMDDGSVRRASRSLTAVWPDRVIIDPVCVNEAQAGPSRYLSEHTEVRFYSRVLEPHVQYAGGAVPWEGDTLVPGEQADHWLTPAADVPVTITSPIDPALEETLTLFGPADVQGIELDYTEGLDGRSLTIGHRLQVDDEWPCVDRLPRTVRMLTPEVCMLGEDRPAVQTVTTNRMGLHVFAAGTCRVEITVDGGGPSVVAEYAVPGPDAPE